jgi:hypothetical protein
MVSETDNVYGGDPELGRLLREGLPRHAAPPLLRAEVSRLLAAPAPRLRWALPWAPPALAACATALVMLLWLAPSLPTGTASDLFRQRLRAIASEHARMVAWGEERPDVIPAALPLAMEESGIALNWVFVGDDDLRLMDARPTYVDGHRAMVLAYRDRRGHTVTYVMMPTGSLTLPERGRVTIDRWRPLLRRENGFSLIVWKQQGLLCALVSDLVSEADLDRFKRYFAAVRASTEPYAGH